MIIIISYVTPDTIVLNLGSMCWLHFVCVCVCVCFKHSFNSRNLLGA
jgi:hypothetical protein